MEFLSSNWGYHVDDAKLYKTCSFLNQLEASFIRQINKARSLDTILIRNTDIPAKNVRRQQTLMPDHSQPDFLDRQAVIS